MAELILSENNKSNLVKYFVLRSAFVQGAKNLAWWNKKRLIP